MIEFWSDFRAKYNIPEYNFSQNGVKYNDNELERYYNKALYKYKNLHIQDIDLINHIAKYNLYKSSIRNNKNENDHYENEYIKYYIDWLLFNECKNLQKYKEQKNNEDKEFNYALKQHKRYKFHYYNGIILWMTSCLWVPYLVGIIHMASEGIFDKFYQILIAAFGDLLIFSFTFPVTIPLSFIIALIIYPKLLKAIMFDQKHPYCEGLMQTLKHSTSQEKKNTAAVMAGTVLSNYIK